MTPATVTGISKTSTLILNTTSNPTLRQAAANPPMSGDVVSIDSKPVAVDTVSLSRQSNQEIISVMKAVPTKVEVKKQDGNSDNTVNSNRNLAGSIPSVDFYYDLKGNLIINYMDSDNNLIYQVPTDLNLYLKEALEKSGASVDTKA